MDSLFLLFLITIFLIKVLISDIVLLVTTFRFYFGFIFFYLYFKSGVSFPVKKLLLLLIFLVPLEAVLINTFISPHSMPNFPSPEAYSHFNVNGYQRPYSFGGNASVSSSIFVILLSMVYFSSIRKYAAIGVVFIFSSGSGLMSLFLLTLLRRAKLFAIFFVFIFAFIGLFHSEIINTIDSFGLKVNSQYIHFLVDYKLEQINRHFDGFNTLDYLIGSLDSIKNGYGGDFAWLYFLKAYGLLSLLFLIVFILSKATKETIIPLLIALFSTFHYPVIFFLPGQIILGYLMARRYRAEL
ncbi:MULTISPECIES: hypothetical protein [Vibrio]|uniref:hypothetical protein n=1 Tax=Vibrio TaxID=662 RepID=UPI001ECF3442|nr:MULTISPECIES: hypothetical protein [unclassified Vibrio]MDA0119793.1 hypothetical protein [Vibrio sp. T11.5]NRB68595.1 hypothetical protein [Vibrio sp.]